LATSCFTSDALIFFRHVIFTMPFHLLENKHSHPNLPALLPVYPYLSHCCQEQQSKRKEQKTEEAIARKKKEQRKNENNQITPNSQQAKYETSYIWADGMNDHREKRG